MLAAVVEGAVKALGAALAVLTVVSGIRCLR
jgi:hypothetical protein